MRFIFVTFLPSMQYAVSFWGLRASGDQEMKLTKASRTEILLNKFKIANTLKKIMLLKNFADRILYIGTPNSWNENATLRRLSLKNQ